MTDEALLAKRIEYAVTRVTKTVFPGRTNHHNTLFGGEALAWMRLLLLLRPVFAVNLLSLSVLIGWISKNLFRPVLLSNWLPELSM